MISVLVQNTPKAGVKLGNKMRISKPSYAKASAGDAKEIEYRTPKEKAE
jgi:hypothetical protein